MAAAAFVMSFYGPLRILIASGLAVAVEDVKGSMVYNAAFLSANYFDLGFIRRGLGGTISRLLGDDPFASAFRLHVMSVLLLIAAFVRLQLRVWGRVSAGAALFMGLFVVVSPQTFVAWSWDEGRTDTLILALISWAALAVLARRPFVAAALLWVGYLVHETAIIFGVPLLVAISLANARSGESTRRRDSAALATLIGALVLTMLIQAVAAPSRDEFISAMFRRAPAAVHSLDEDLIACAIYMMTTGLRGLVTSMCFNGYYPWYVPLVMTSVVVALLSAVALGLDRVPVLFVLGVLLPMLFLNVVATDVGRWLKLAVASSWILSIVVQSRGLVRFDGRRVAVGACILIALISMGATRVYEVNRTSSKLLDRLGGEPYPVLSVWMTHCDPQWRDIVHRPGTGTEPQ